MALDKSAFRAAFPEFVSVTEYPDAMLEWWYAFGLVFVDETKWGSYYVQGTYLVLAHLIVLAKNNTISAGTNSGLVNNESAGDVSVGYDTGGTSEKDAGNWNLTSYGQIYLRLARMIGGVAVQL